MSIKEIKDIFEGYFCGKQNSNINSSGPWDLCHR